MSGAEIVFGLYFIVIISLTFYSVRRMAQVSEEDFSSEYFVGGRKLGPVSLAILVAAGVVSTGTFIGGPGVAAQNGPGFYILFGMGQLIMNLLILGILGKKINIIGRRTNSETFIDIFRYRYENYKPLVFLLVVSILIFLIAAATAEFTGGSRVIQSMTGIPFTYSLIAFGAIITLYTALGGLKAVSLVAVVQGVVMTIGSIVLLVGYIRYSGGVTPIFDKVREVDPQLMAPGGGTPLFAMLGFWLTYGIGLLGLPWAVQASLGYKSTKTMKLAIVIGIVMVSFWSIFMGLGGVAARAAFPDLAVPDFAIPRLTEAVLPSPLAGLVLAGVAGAGQSTIGALFILASGSVVVNAYKAFVNPSVSGAATRRLSIGSTVVIGLITVILALNPPPSLQIFITFSAGGSAAAFAPPLVLGLFWSRTNKYGAFAGVLGGLVGYILFSQVSLGFEPLMSAPLLFAAPLSIVLTIGVSLVTAEPPEATIRTYFGVSELVESRPDDKRGD